MNLIPVSACTYSIPLNIPVVVYDLKDGCYVNSDYRRFEKRGAVFYYEDGEVEYPNGADVLSISPCEVNFTGVSPANWTEEQRSQVRARVVRERAEREAAAKEAQRQWEEEQTRRQALRESAKAKLTSEEYDAVFQDGYDEGSEY